MVDESLAQTIYKSFIDIGGIGTWFQFWSFDFHGLNELTDLYTRQDIKDSIDHLHSIGLIDIDWDIDEVVYDLIVTIKVNSPKEIVQLR